MTIDIPDDVSLRLQELAQEHDTDLGTLLRDMIERCARERPADE